MGLLPHLDQVFGGKSKGKNDVSIEECLGPPGMVGGIMELFSLVFGDRSDMVQQDMRSYTLSRLTKIHPRKPHSFQDCEGGSEFQEEAAFLSETSG